MTEAPGDSCEVSPSAAVSSVNGVGKWRRKRRRNGDGVREVFLVGVYMVGGDGWIDVMEEEEEETRGTEG